MTALSFSEELTGYVSFHQSDFNQALREGRQAGRTCTMAVTVSIDDVDRFVADPEHLASVSGWVTCDALGGRLPVEAGRFNLLVDEPDVRHRRMRYRLFLRDPRGHPLTLAGFKVIEDDPNYDSWSDTTTLFVRLYAGHVGPDDQDAAGVVATGVLRIGSVGLVRQLASYAAEGGSLRERLAARARFFGMFVRDLRRVYAGPTLPDTRPSFPTDGEPPDVRGWETVEGRPELRRRSLSLAPLGGIGNVQQIAREGTPDGEPVLLVHGSGVRANLFYGDPRGDTIVEALLDAGYDVWVENWRGSIDLPPRPYTLDEVASQDHPAAVRTVLRETGRETLRALVHCQGSTSFSLAAVAGLVPEATTVVSTAVSLHPVVPWQARLKQRAVLPVISGLTPYADPQWAIRPPTPLARGMATVAALRRRECDDRVCALSNYMFGAGGEVLWRHENLHPETHAWLAREFGFTPFRVMRQLARSVGAGHLVPTGALPELPADLLDRPPRTEARFAFVAGTANRLFLPESQRRSFEWMERWQPGRHSLHVLDGYTHLDLYVGRRAPEEVYPTILEALAA